MPIYHLTPVLARLADPAWNTSRGRGECWVNGADEEECRALAAGHFQDATQTIPGQPSPHSVWRDPGLVEAHLLERAPDNMTIPNGTVVFTNQA